MASAFDKILRHIDNLNVVLDSNTKVAIMEKRTRSNILIRSILTFGLEHVEEKAVFELAKRTLTNENVCVKIYDSWRERRDIKALYDFLKDYYQELYCISLFPRRSETLSKNINSLDKLIFSIVRVVGTDRFASLSQRGMFARLMKRLLFVGSIIPIATSVFVRVSSTRNNEELGDYFHKAYAFIEKIYNSRVECNNLRLPRVDSREAFRMFAENNLSIANVLKMFGVYETRARYWKLLLENLSAATTLELLGE